MASTPEQFAGKLRKSAAAVKSSNRKALEARALVTKRGVLAAAATRSRKVKPNWVAFKALTDDLVELRLRGGFAVLFEKGSYKKTGGYDERAKKATAGRRRTAAKKGLKINESGLMRTPYGPRAVVHHPYVKPKPYLHEGVQASRAQGRKAYEKIQRDAIASAFR